MRHILTRISVPARLMDEMMLKTAGCFDIPNTPEGVGFVQWWETASTADRDATMKYAHENNVTLLAARNREIDG